MSLFNLRHPRDFTSPTSRRGTLCRYQMHSPPHICTPCSAGRGSFIARSAAEQAGGARVHHGASEGYAGLHGARSGGSQSRDLAGSHGIALRRAQPRRTLDVPQRKIFALVLLLLLLYNVCSTPPPDLSGSLLCGRHGATAVAHQAVLFVTATEGACACLCHVSCRPRVGNRCCSAQGAGRY